MKTNKEQTKVWTITTLDEAPAMTRTPIQFVGTFSEAIDEATRLWRERNTAWPCVCSNGATTHSWFMIDSKGVWTNRNFVPTTTGSVTL